MQVKSEAVHFLFFFFSPAQCDFFVTGDAIGGDAGLVSKIALSLPIQKFSNDMLLRGELFYNCGNLISTMDGCGDFFVLFFFDMNCQVTNSKACLIGRNDEIV
jgi:hypothetical protein